MDMALIIVDQESESKQYLCKICKKGFGCGRALGGHMRAHGIRYDDHSFDYDHMDTEEEEEGDDHTSDWEDNDVVAPTNNNDKTLYGLRTNPNRLKTTRVCENCDKEFLSWKSFLEHKAANKCTSSNDADSVVSSADHQDYSTINMRNTGWSKRKRSMRAKVISTEEEDLANCLMLLSNAGNTMIVNIDQPEESCASASRDDHDHRDKLRTTTTMIQMIIPPSPPNNKTAKLGNNNNTNKGVFECKACKKVFNSHQALGGHRASHKKVKGCFAAAADDDVITVQHDDTFFLPKFHPGSVNNKRKLSSKVHECSICHRVFSSGQALGGHKRCHWITSNNNNNSSSTAAKLIHLEKSQQIIIRRNNNLIRNTTSENSVDLSLELNLHSSPPTTNVVCVDYSSGHLKNKKKNENGSAWSMVDDEAESKVKLAKLSELKDINLSNGNSSPWLQVGIGASAARRL